MKIGQLTIRADADNKIGAGHIMRCIALGQAWKRRGGSVRFISRLSNKTIENIIRSENFSLTHIAPQDSLNANRLQIETILHKTQSQWIVLDGYQFKNEQHKQYKKNGQKILIIDDYNHLPFYEADILLNQNIGSNKFNYQCSPNTKKLFGNEYVLLRNEFLHPKIKIRKRHGKVRNILVTMGGADPDNTNLQILKSLSKLHFENLSVRVRMVTGYTPRHIKSLAVEKKKSGLNIEFIKNTKNMPGLMEWSDICISAGGSTAWELSYMGVPTVYISIAKNQVAIVNELEKHQSGINGGWYMDLNPEILSKVIRNLIQNTEHRKSLSLNARKLVNGTGADKVVETIIARS